MCRMYERGTKARLTFSGRPHTPANMADSMEEVNEGGNGILEMFAPLHSVLYFIHHVFANP